MLVRKLLTSYLAPGALFALLLAGWEAYVRIFKIPPYILPSPTRILKVMGESSDMLLHHTWITLGEIMAGFFLAFVTGLALAIAIVYSRVLEKVLYPLIIASQTIPVFAIAPLLIIWFGYGLIPKVVMAAIIAFFPLVVNTVDGLRSVDVELLNLMQTLKATSWQLFRKIRFPAALPFIFSGVRVAIAVSVIGAVFGEWVGSDVGLGFLMKRSNAQLRTDLLFAAIVVLSILGVGLFALVTVLERICLPWRVKPKEGRTVSLEPWR
jgi:ABC-type nitrate/sulfonate/bicarbonate transport system permease component